MNIVKLYIDNRLPRIFIFEVLGTGRECMAVIGGDNKAYYIKSESERYDDNIRGAYWTSKDVARCIKNKAWEITEVISS